MASSELSGSGYKSYSREGRFSLREVDAVDFLGLSKLPSARFVNITLRINNPGEFGEEARPSRYPRGKLLWSSEYRNLLKRHHIPLPPEANEWKPISNPLFVSSSRIVVYPEGSANDRQRRLRVYSQQTLPMDDSFGKIVVSSETDAHAKLIQKHVPPAAFEKPYVSPLEETVQRKILWFAYKLGLAELPPTGQLVVLLRTQRFNTYIYGGDNNPPEDTASNSV